MISTKNIESKLDEVNKSLRLLLTMVSILLLVETPDDKKDQMAEYIKEIVSEE